MTKDRAAAFWGVVYNTGQIEFARLSLFEREKTVERGMSRVESWARRRRRKEICVVGFLGVVSFCNGSY